MPDYTVTTSTTQLSFDGTGFDATRVQSGTPVVVNGITYLFYGAEPFDNHYSIGLAISTDGQNFVRASDNPVISYVSSTPFTSFRVIPEKAFYDTATGVWTLFFWGNNVNLAFESGNMRGMGVATSLDGVNWDIRQEPLLVEAGPSQGITLEEIVKVSNGYIAYVTNEGTPAEGNAPMISFSSDGINFSAPQVAPWTVSEALLTATSYGDGVLAVFATSQPDIFRTGYSTDGVNFEYGGTFECRADLIDEIVVTETGVELWLSVSVGNVNWSFGNVQIRTVEVPLDIFPVVQDPETPVSTGFAMPVGPRTGAIATDSAGDADGWFVASDFSESYTKNGVTSYHLGEDWNFVSPSGQHNAQGQAYDDLGSSVYAASNGKVVYAGPHYGPALNFGTGYGNLVVIEHKLQDGRVVYSLYAHLQSIDPDIKVGTIVDSTSVEIGTLGSTGASATPHLHFEIFEGDWKLAVSEIAYLNAPLQSDASHTQFYSGGTYFWQTQVNGVWTSSAVQYDPQSVTWFDPSEFILGTANVDAGDPVVLTGGTGSDSIVGGSGSDTLSGGNGNDSVFGGRGRDQIDGGNGTDLIAGGSGNDVISGGKGDDALRGDSGDDRLLGQEGSDMIEGGTGRDYIDGGAGADVLSGDSGSDQIFGGQGADTLIGGSGDDVLSGGQGADVFVFGTFLEEDGQFDQILDFASGDRIRFMSGPTEFDDLHLSQVGGNVLVTWGDDLSISLQNARLASITADTFLFG